MMWRCVRRILLCTALVFVLLVDCEGAPLAQIYRRTVTRISEKEQCKAPYTGKKLATFQNTATIYADHHAGKDADLIKERIASKPIAVWIGDWSGNPEAMASAARDEAKNQNAMYTIVAYNIPNRDCNHHSGNNMKSGKEYLDWITKLANGLKGGDGIVVLEPDALALTDCLSEELKVERYSLLEAAVKVLKTSGAKVYIDSGHANWLDPEEVVRRLKKAGIHYADGFALNTANGVSTERSIRYGNYISRVLGHGQGYVIDVSRNGGSIEGEGEQAWCNSPSFRLGNDPTLETEEYGCFVDALLWIKVPGESDGECGGNPAAGEFSSELAMQLMS